MQIDFHHAVTYVTARAAGFDHDSADVVAHAAQYVDDATEGGLIDFDNGAMYVRVSSAHKTVDLHFLDHHDNLQVSVPFHFLPGNRGKAAGEGTADRFIYRLVCTPNSPIANEMVDSAIRCQDRPYSLHRLGIAMHTYADTWAHQGFAGVNHDVNLVDDAEEIGSSHFRGGLTDFLSHLIEHAAPSMGHARAGVLPDFPFLRWRYRNGLGQEIVRDNTTLFEEAADWLCKAMQRYRAKDPAAVVPGLGPADKQVIHDLLASLRTTDADERHQKWLQQIQAGRFSFGSATVTYSESAWKMEALPTSAVAVAAAGAGVSATIVTPYHYSEAFLESNWKLFHDALQLHRLTVLHDILPKYGICSG